MGISISANIAFGFSGTAYDDEGNPVSGWSEADDYLDDLSWEDQQALEKEFGVEIAKPYEDGYHLIISASLTRAHWGYPTNIDLGKLVAQPDWREKMRGFAERVGLKIQAEAQGEWLLFADSDLGS